MTILFPPEFSNSFKFTPANGKIRVNTRLISPRSPRTSTSSVVAGSTLPRLQPRTTSQHLTPPESQTGGLPQGLLLGGSSSSRWEDDPDRVVVRIEVIDTGCGISPSDVKERRLFSPYAQAGVGRFQGGSGTGLGLSLVRRIVKLMGGRMGVESVVSIRSVSRGHIHRTDDRLDQKKVGRWNDVLGGITCVHSRHSGSAVSKNYIAALRIAISPILPTVESMLAAPSVATLPMVSEPAVTPDSSVTVTAPAMVTTPPPLVSSPMSNRESTHAGPAHASENPGLGHSDTTGFVPLSLLSGRSSMGESTLKAPKVPTREHATSIQSSVGMGLSVLVVDDDPILRELLQRLLVRLGCEVEGAENGQVALRKLGVMTEEALVSEAKSNSVPEDVGLEGPWASISSADTGVDSKRDYDGLLPSFVIISC